MKEGSWVEPNPIDLYLFVSVKRDIVKLLAYLPHVSPRDELVLKSDLNLINDMPTEIILRANLLFGGCLINTLKKMVELVNEYLLVLNKPMHLANVFK